MYKSILKYWLPLIVLLPFGLKAQVFQDSMTLDSWLDKAVQTNINERLANRDLELAQLDYKLFTTTLKPRLTASANFPNYSRTSQEIIQPNGTVLFQPIRNNNSALGLELTQNIPLTGGFLFVNSNLQRFDDFENDNTLYNGVPIRFGFFQPLFGFNSFKWDKRIQPLQLEEANRKFVADKEAIKEDATRLFFSLLLAQVNLEIANSNAESNQSLFEIAQERFNLGKISDSDLMQLRVSLLSAQRNQRNAFQSVQQASTNMFAFIGQIYNGEIITLTSPEIEDPINVDLEIAQEQSRVNRFENIQYNRLQLQRQSDVEEAKRSGGFQADLTASFGLTRSAMNVSEIYDQPIQEQFAQIQVSVPIIDWGQQKATVARTKALKEYTDEWIRQDQNRLSSEVSQAVFAFQNVQQELLLAKELRQVSEDRFEISKQSFVLGAISITDLTISQQEKDQAARTYTLALSNYWQNYYRLRGLTLYDFQNRQKIAY
ncbi:MAG: TolC family protein [Bacteroidota bacterium]